MKKLTLTQGKLMIWDMPKMPDINDWINDPKAEGVEVVNASMVTGTCFITREAGLCAFQIGNINEGESINLPDGLDIKYEEQVLCGEDEWKSVNCFFGLDRSHNQFRKIARIIQKPVEKEHSFCVTPGSGCNMNYCDENGCQDRKRELVDTDEIRETMKSDDHKIHSLKAELKEKDEEIAALKEAKGMQLVSSEFENGYLREQIKILINALERVDEICGIEDESKAIKLVNEIVTDIVYHKKYMSFEKGAGHDFASSVDSKKFDPEKCDCLQMQYVARMANAYEAEIESIRGENTELRQALKEAVDNLERSSKTVYYCARFYS